MQLLPLLYAFLRPPLSPCVPPRIALLPFPGGGIPLSPALPAFFPPSRVVSFPPYLFFHVSLPLPLALSAVFVRLPPAAFQDVLPQHLPACVVPWQWSPGVGFLSPLLSLVLVACGLPLPPVVFAPLLLGAIAPILPIPALHALSLPPLPPFAPVQPPLSLGVYLPLLLSPAVFF